MPRKSTSKFPWQITALVLFLLPILIALGFWQLHRAEEKRSLQAKFDEHQKSTPLTLQQITHIKNPNYYPVSVEGYFDNQHTFLVDNQFDHHRIGYQIITPFIPSHNQPIVLVNRGWLSKEKLAIPLIKHKTHIKGLLFFPQKNPLISNIFEAKEWPQKMLTIDTHAIASRLHKKTYPWVILLDSQSPYGFVRHWQPVNMKASMHTGYAFQWFSMAFVLIVIYVISRMRRS